MPRESTSKDVASKVARALPLSYLRFCAFIALPENFKAVKSGLASALSQYEPTEAGGE